MSIDLRGIGPDLEGALARMFEAIAKDPAARHFRPHRFDRAAARRIARYRGRDEYYAALRADEMIGYGMLRGWDEGYDIPSLGLYIAPTARREGLASRLMDHLHQAAQRRGSRQVRLTVDRDNAAALSLYRRKGYVFQELDAARLLGMLTFPPPL